MPTVQDVLDDWRMQGGTWLRFAQSEFLTDNPTVTTIKYKDKTENRITTDVSEGICHALSLRFIECRMMEFTPSQIMPMIESALPICAVQQTAISSGAKSGTQAGGVKGKGITGKGLLGWGRPFNSRRELADFLENTPGLFEYGMYGYKKGHSVAFDTRGGNFSFFDANSGIWSKTGPFATADQLYFFIYQYWTVYGYKTSYEGGRRDLHQFA